MPGGKKKKSGAQNRKIKRLRLESEKKSSGLLQNYFNINAATDEASIDADDDFDSDGRNEIAPSLNEEHDNYVSELSPPPSMTDTILDDDVGDCSSYHLDSDTNDSICNESLSDIENLADQHISVTKYFEPLIVNSKKLTLDEKIAYLKLKAYHPSKTFLLNRKKKIGSKERHCSEHIFSRKDGSERSWLTYCQDNDSLFCIPCILFTDEASRGEHIRRNQGSAFTKEGFSNWKKQFEYVQQHEESKSHMNSKIAEALFIQQNTIADKLTLQNQHQETKRKREVETNRKVMLRIINTILLLAKQDMPFRGRHESLTSEPSTNIGNFLECLKYLSQYDEVISSHLDKVRSDQEKSKSKNRDGKKRSGRGSKLTFLSKDTQNKLINIISSEIVDAIVEMINDCAAWALMADTTPDVTKHEQLSLCVRVVSKQGNVSEHLLFMVRVESTTASELVSRIGEELKKRGICFRDLVAQTYDGASNISGRYNGLQAKLKELAGVHVLYTHCYSHSLNLVLSDTAKSSIDVSTLFDKLQQIYVLFSRSQPIHQLFEERQRDLKLKITSIKRIDTVRWSSREFCLQLFLERYDAIMDVLEMIPNGDFNKDQIKTADGLSEAFSKKQYLASAYLFREIFSITGPLSRILQGVNIDFSKALQLVDAALVQLAELRKNPQKIIEAVEVDFDGVQWFEKRIVRKKRMPGEICVDEPAKSAKEKWERDVFYLSIDNVISGINNRFLESRNVLKAFSVFCPSNFSTFYERFSSSRELEIHIRDFCETYKIDSYRCANELYSFAESYKHFDTEVIHEIDFDPDVDSDNSDVECDVNDSQVTDHGLLKGTA